MGLYSKMATNFNPHHREGGDDAVLYHYSDSQTISIHTTAKVVTVAIKIVTIHLNLSIHTTAKVVTVRGRENCIYPLISIHTTAKVVTDTALYKTIGLEISIHTTAKVVTKCYSFLI